MHRGRGVGSGGGAGIEGLTVEHIGSKMGRLKKICVDGSSWGVGVLGSGSG